MLIRKKKESRRSSIETVKTKGVAPFVEKLIPGLFAPDFAKTHPDLIETLIARATLYPSEGITHALQAMHDRPDQSEVLKNFQQPVLFIIGGEDTAIPKEASLNQTTLPDTSSIFILEKVGHMGMFEGKEEAQAAVVDFLELCKR